MEKGRLKKIYILTGLFAVTACLVAIYKTPASAVQAERKLKTLPTQIGNWAKTADLSFDSKVLDILGTRNAFGTVYKNPDGRTVRVVIVQAVNNRSAFHPPEYCLTGGGSEVIAKQVREVPLAGAGSLKVNEMVFVTDNKDRFVVWNWYTAGKDATENFYRQQLGLVWRMVRTRYAKGTMVNLFASVGPYEEPGDAAPVAQDFTQSLMPYLNEYL